LFFWFREDDDGGVCGGHRHRGTLAAVRSVYHSIASILQALSGPPPSHQNHLSKAIIFILQKENLKYRQS